jgi:hypothetical protein
VEALDSDSPSALLCTGAIVPFRRCRLACSGLLIAAFILGCSDSAGPGDGTTAVRFRYVDGQSDAFVIATDSALYQTAEYPTASTKWYLTAMAYVLPTSTLIGVRTLRIEFDSIGGSQIGAGMYDVGAAPLFGRVYMTATDLRAFADSGTITITKSDSAYISGTLDLFFTYYQYVSVQPPPFHLTGPFKFRNIGTAPLPPF